MNQIVSTMTQDPKIAAGVATTTMGSGIAKHLEWIPADIGEIATLLGIALSLVLIFTHWRQHKLKMKILKFDLKERTIRNGKRTRRDD